MVMPYTMSRIAPPVGVALQVTRTFAADVCPYVPAVAEVHGTMHAPVVPEVKVLCVEQKRAAVVESPMVKFAVVPVIVLVMRYATPIIMELAGRQFCPVSVVAAPVERVVAAKFVSQATAPKVVCEPKF